MKKPLKKNEKKLIKNAPIQVRRCTGNLAKYASRASYLYNTIRSEKKMRGGISDKLIGEITPFIKDHSIDVFHLKYKLLDKLCDNASTAKKKEHYDKELKDLKNIYNALSSNPELYTYNIKDLKTDKLEINNLLYTLQLAKSIYSGFKKLPSLTTEIKEISSKISTFNFNKDYITNTLLKADTQKAFTKEYDAIKLERSVNPEKLLPLPMPLPQPTLIPIKQDPAARIKLLEAALILSKKIVLKYEGKDKKGKDKEGKDKERKDKDEEGKGKDKEGKDKEGKDEVEDKDEEPVAKNRTKWNWSSFAGLFSKKIINTLEKRIERYKSITKKLKDITPFTCLKRIIKENIKEKTITYVINKNINLTKVIGSRSANGTIYLTTINNGFGRNKLNLVCKIMKPTLDNKNEIKINEWITENLLLNEQSKHFALTYKSTECIAYDKVTVYEDRLVNYIELFEGDLSVLLSKEYNEKNENNIDYSLIINILCQTFICIATYQKRVGLCHRDTHLKNFLYQTNSEEGYYHYKYDDTEFYIKSCKYNIIIHDFGISKKFQNEKKLNLRHCNDYSTLLYYFYQEYKITNIDFENLKNYLFKNIYNKQNLDIFKIFRDHCISKKCFLDKNSLPKNATILNKTPFIINRVDTDQSLILNVDNSLENRVNSYHTIIRNKKNYFIEDNDDMYYPIQNTKITLDEEFIRNNIIQEWITDNLILIGKSKHYALIYNKEADLNIRDSSNKELINYTEKCSFDLNNLSLDDNDIEDDELIMNMLFQAFICIATYHNMVGLCYSKITANNFLVQTNYDNGYYRYTYDDKEFYIKSCKYNIIINDFRTSVFINDNDESKKVQYNNYKDILDIFKRKFIHSSIKTKLNLISTNLFSTNPNPKYIKDFTFKDIIENIEIIFSKNKESKIYLETNSNLNILNDFIVQRFTPFTPTPFIINTKDQTYADYILHLKSTVREAVLNKVDYDAYINAKKNYDDAINELEKNVESLLKDFSIDDKDNIRSIKFKVPNNDKDTIDKLGKLNKYLLDDGTKKKEINKIIKEAITQQEVTQAYLDYVNKFSNTNNYMDTFVKEFVTTVPPVPPAQPGGNPTKYKSTGNTVFILYKKRKYKRTIYVKDKRRTKYCKINNEYILLSKLKIIE